MPELQKEVQKEGIWGSGRAAQILCLLASVEVPAGLGTGTGVSPVSLDKAEFLGDKQAMECERGAGMLICCGWRYKLEVI